MAHHEGIKAIELVNDSQGDEIIGRIVSGETVLLATALLNVPTGNIVTPCRALCDSGSQLNLITKACALRLGTRSRYCNDGFVRGIGSSTGTAINQKVNLTIRAWFNEKLELTADFFLIAELPGPLPNRPLFGFDLPDGITFADPKFNVPDKIDLLLGAEIWARMIGDCIYRHSYGAMLQGTIFGFIVLGRFIVERNKQFLSCFHLTEQMEPNENMEQRLDIQLRQFWEIEELLEKPKRSPIEELVEQIFMETHCRDHTGRYVVDIPIDPNRSKLGSTRDVARKRFLMLERRLQRNEELRTKYVDFMREYERLGHMQIATSDPMAGKIAYHIPHHCVEKKFRVVFDASCVSTSGQSFNDIQLVGEKLQFDLADIIVRFRRHKIAIGCDVKKMFRQVRINPDQWDCQRIFWRENPNEPLLEYWLTVVTYGMASSVHSSVRAMVQCARDGAGEFPEASQIVQKDFYIDDCLTGADDVDEAMALCKQLDALMKSGGFELGKWISNRNEIHRLMQCPDEPIIELSDEPDTKILGLRWITATDELTFRVNKIEMAAQPTKRAVVSETAKLYDPNGYLSPIIIRPKTLIQDLWRLGVDWDHAMPPQLQNRWHDFYGTLELLQNVRIPRWIGSTQNCSVQLHGFADASCRAYGAVIYVRIADAHDNIQCQLLTSKSRVAPVKTVSIPRLELMAAELLGRLLRRTIDVCEFNNVNYFLWTDSTVVLHWLRKLPCDLKTFVANRVASIQTTSNVSAWAHVASQENPADLISRGMAISDFIDSELWFGGPSWLKQPQGRWPKPKLTVTADTLEQFGGECKPQNNHDVLFICSALLIEKHEVKYSLIDAKSSLGKVQRITAYVLRFIHNCKKRRKKDRIFCRTPTPLEMRKATMYWAKCAQEEFFSKEMKGITGPEKKIPSNSKLLELNPRLEDGVLLVGGRIDQADLPHERRHPIIVPPDSRLCWLILHQAHQATLHGAAQVMIRYIRNEYWIPKLRFEARTFVGRCKRCFRMMKKTAEQLMGDLPLDRLREARPFLKTGVDFAGPYGIKSRASYPNTRSAAGGRVDAKGYVAVFVCLVTRAVHLELVTSMTSEAFIVAFRRFTARRGFCAELYSDNGTTFVGANTEMKKAIETWEESNTLDFMASRGTQWHFITPAAPFKGGIWEAAVKSMKHHLRRVMGLQKFSYEPFHTLLVEIEAVLNSRPICAESDDPNDARALTPATFWNQGPLIMPLPEQMREPPKDRLRLWQNIQFMVQDFWRQWSADYLNTLQQRKKWKEERENMRVGQLALIKSENFPPTHWALGRIVDVHHGADNLVRSVSIMLGDKDRTVLERPVQKLCILPMDDEPGLFD